VLLSLLNTHHGESFSWRGVHKEMMATLQWTTVLNAW
jgi:hypothetical protein